MERLLSGKAFVVGDAIDTDQIIPAEHLVYSITEPEERKMYGRFAMSAVPTEKSGLPLGGIPFTDPGKHKSQFSIIIAGSNFGCGSSREHAPFALREAGCVAVVARSFARIFYRNSIDGGFLVPFETRQDLGSLIRTGDELTLDTNLAQLTNDSTGDVFLLNPLGEVAEILRAGGVFEYARRAGMIS